MNSVEKRRDPGKEEFWREAMEKHSGSGISIREFCKEENLAEHDFYRWRRELAYRDNERSRQNDRSNSGFVELVAAVAGKDFSGVELSIDGKMSIRLARGFDPETLKAALATIARTTE